MELCKKGAHESQSIFHYSRSYSKQHTSRMCSYCVFNLLVLRSQLFSFTFVPQSSWGHKSVLGMVCFLPTSEGSQHHLGQNIGLVCETCSTSPVTEKWMDNRNLSTVKIVKSHNSNFKNLRKKWGTAQAAPAALLPTAMHLQLSLRLSYVIKLSLFNLACVGSVLYLS